MTQCKSTTTKICPICSTENLQLSKYNLYKCLDCKLLIATQIWSDDINQLNDEYFGEDYGNRISSFWVKLFEFLNNRRNISRLKKLLPHKGQILEVGVGSGSLLMLAKKKGYEVMGCDLSEAICHAVSTDTNIEMYCGSIEELRNKKKIDLIIMLHVIEHVQNPIMFLKHAKDLLSPGGKILMACPNVGCWEALLPGWNSYEPYHLTYFNPKTVKKLVEIVGFSKAKIYTHDSFSGGFLAILRTILGVRLESHASLRISCNHKIKKPLSVISRILEHGYRISMIFFGLLTFPIREAADFFGYGDEVVCEVEL